MRAFFRWLVGSVLNLIETKAYRALREVMIFAVLWRILDSSL